MLRYLLMRKGTFYYRYRKVLLAFNIISLLLNSFVNPLILSFPRMAQAQDWPEFTTVTDLGIQSGYGSFLIDYAGDSYFSEAPDGQSVFYDFTPERRGQLAIDLYYNHPDTSKPVLLTFTGPTGSTIRSNDTEVRMGTRKFGTLTDTINATAIGFGTTLGKDLLADSIGDAITKILGGTISGGFIAPMAKTILAAAETADQLKAVGAEGMIHYAIIDQPEVGKSYRFFLEPTTDQADPNYWNYEFKSNVTVQRFDQSAEDSIMQQRWRDYRSSEAIGVFEKLYLRSFNPKYGEVREKIWSQRQTSSYIDVDYQGQSNEPFYIDILGPANELPDLDERFYVEFIGTYDATQTRIRKGSSWDDINLSDNVFTVETVISGLIGLEQTRSRYLDTVARTKLTNNILGYVDEIMLPQKIDFQAFAAPQLAGGAASWISSAFLKEMTQNGDLIRVKFNQPVKGQKYRIKIITNIAGARYDFRIYKPIKYEYKVKPSVPDGYSSPDPPEQTVGIGVPARFGFSLSNTGEEKDRYQIFISPKANRGELSSWNIRLLDEYGTQIPAVEPFSLMTDSSRYFEVEVTPNNNSIGRDELQIQVIVASAHHSTPISFKTVARRDGAPYSASISYKGVPAEQTVFDLNSTPTFLIKTTDEKTGQAVNAENLNLRFGSITEDLTDNGTGTPGEYLWTSPPLTAGQHKISVLSYEEEVGSSKINVAVPSGLAVGTPQFDPASALTRQDINISVPVTVDGQSFNDADSVVASITRPVSGKIDSLALAPTGGGIYSGIYPRSATDELGAYSVQVRAKDFGKTDGVSPAGSFAVTQRPLGNSQYRGIYRDLTQGDNFSIYDDGNVLNDEGRGTYLFSVNVPILREYIGPGGKTRQIALDIYDNAGLYWPISDDGRDNNSYPSGFESPLGHRWYTWNYGNAGIYFKDNPDSNSPVYIAVRGAARGANLSPDPANSTVSFFANQFYLYHLTNLQDYQFGASSLELIAPFGKSFQDSGVWSFYGGDWRKDFVNQNYSAGTADIEFFRDVLTGVPGNNNLGIAIPPLRGNSDYSIYSLPINMEVPLTELKVISKNGGVPSGGTVEGRGLPGGSVSYDLTLENSGNVDFNQSEAGQKGIYINAPGVQLTGEPALWPDLATPPVAAGTSLKLKATVNIPENAQPGSAIQSSLLFTAYPIAGASISYPIILRTVVPQPLEAKIVSPINGQVIAFSDQPITFDGSASTPGDGSIVSYDWNFGDGRYGGNAVTSHTYSNPGTYHVTLSVVDALGRTSMTGIHVTVRDPNRNYIAGQVRKLDGTTPVEGAIVFAEQNGVQIMGAVTDASGNYLIEDLPPDSYDVTAYMGQRYSQTRKNVVVSGGLTTKGIDLLIGAAVTNMSINPGDITNSPIYVSYHLGNPSSVKAEIKDSSGTTVKNFPWQDQMFGYNSLSWDLTDDNNNYVPDGLYWITVNGTDTEGYPLQTGLAAVTVDRTPAVISGMKAVPEIFSPNGDGLADATTIIYSLSSNTNLTAKIYDQTENLIKTLVDKKPRLAGTSVYDLWDGTNDAGYIVDDGTYAIEFSGMDEAGNISLPQTINITVSGATPMPPETSITAPFNGEVILETSRLITGTAFDNTFISRVEVSIMRDDGKYWNGSDWLSSPEVWLLASGTSSWSYNWTSIQLDRGATYTIKARAIDITDRYDQTPAIVTARVPDPWQQVITGGFDDISNQAILPLVVFNGFLYAGTYNYLTGGELWRSADGFNWTSVASSGFGDVNNLGVWAWAEFNGYLYAGTEQNTVTGTEVWRSSDGINWAQTNIDGFGDANNKSVGKFVEFNGYLYGGTWNLVTGAEIWRTANGTDWEQANVDGFGDLNNRSSGSLAAFNGMLYAATGNPTGTQVWRTSDGVNWTQVVTGGFGDPNNNARGLALFTFNNNLYLSTENRATGTEVWRSNDGSSWVQVNIDGFGDINNYDSRGAAVFDGVLYLGVHNTVTGAEIWKSGNGSNWSQVNIDGFGYSTSEKVFLLTFKDMLLAGVDNRLTGGQLWIWPDKRAPFTTLELTPVNPDGQNGWFKTSSAITLTPDETATTYYQWDSTSTASWITYSGQFAASEGEHTLYFYSVDNAGNIETIQERLFKVDPESPTVSALSGSTSGSNIDLFWTPSSDNVSGLAGYGIYSVETTPGAQLFEDFDANMFPTTWTRSDYSVDVDAFEGFLRINDDNGYDDWAQANVSLTLPTTIEARMRLVSGGLNYLLPSIHANFGNNPTDNIHVTYLSDPWGSPGTDWGWSFGVLGQGERNADSYRAPAGENEWVTVRAIIRTDGGELQAKREYDPDFQTVATRTWSIPDTITSIRLRQPWDAVSDFDYIRAGDSLIENDSLIATTTATSYSFSDLPDGTYDYYIRAYDNAGNLSPKSNSLAFTLPSDEVLSPVTTLTLEPIEHDGANGWYKTSPKITLTPDETATTYYQWDSAASPGWITYTAPFNAIEGAHTLNYYSVDQAGNVEAIKSQVIKVDTGLPTVNLNTPPISTIQSASTTFGLSWSGSDSVSGMDTYSLQVKQNQSGVWQTLLIDTTATTTLYTGTTGNTYYFRLTGRDKAGNTKTVTKATALPYDCGDPTVVYTGSWSVSPAAGRFLNAVHKTTAAGDTATLTFTGNRVALIAEKSSQGSNIEIRIDGGAPVYKSLYSSTTKKRQVIYTSPTLSYGPHTIAIRNLATAGRPEANVDAIAVIK